jgi:hypothetical protein
MQPAEVIDLVMASGDRLTPEGSQLRVRAPQSVLTDGVRHSLRQHKEAILRLLCGDQPVSAAPKIHEDGGPLSLSHNSQDSHHRLPLAQSANCATTGSAPQSDANAFTAGRPPAIVHQSPTPDHHRGDPCPICGSRDQWSWVQGRELCRFCLLQGTDPVVAVKVFSPSLGGNVWVIDDTLPHEEWPTDAPVYTHAEVKRLTHVGPDTLAWVHPAKELFGARVVDARRPQEKGGTANG